MKKKILFIFSLAVFLVCMLAISVSAAVQIDGIYYSLSGSGENATATVTIDNVNCEKVDVVIPQTVTHEGQTYTVTTIANHAFGGTSFGANQTIKSIVIPETVTSIGSHFLRGCSVETVVIKANTKDLTSAQFYNCTKLTSVDMSESTIENITIAFTNCSALETVKFPSTLKSLNDQAFFGCSKLASVDLSDTVLETIGGKVFQNCSSLSTIKLPSTFKGFTGTNAIQQTSMTTLVLPHGLQTLVNTSLPQNYSLYMVVFPEIDETVTGIGSNPFHDNNGKPEVVIYSGNNYEYVTGTGMIFAGYTVAPFSEYDPTRTYTGRNLFYGADTCDECNGLVNKQEENKCCGICSNCGEKDIFDNPEHTTEWTVIGAYLTGYTATNTCIYCENDINSEIIDPLFTSKGYSCTVFDGVISIVQGFDINREAIARYEELADKQVSYGVVATSVNKVADGNIDVVNNVDGVTAIDFTSAEKKEFTRFEIKVADIAEANQDTGLYACAYVIEDGAVSFISENACTAQAVAKTAAAILQENPV